MKRKRPEFSGWFFEFLMPRLSSIPHSRYETRLDFWDDLRQPDEKRSQLLLEHPLGQKSFAHERIWLLPTLFFQPDESADWSQGSHLRR